MSEDAKAPLTISREDLYELVWSKPMSELARDFGISDVALAKRCRRLGVPVPGRGYWARVDAGQEPYRPQLPKREAQWSDEGALTVGPSQDAPPYFDPMRGPSSPEEGSGPSSPQQKDQVWLSERIASEEQPDKLIKVPNVAKVWDPVIKKFAESLENAAREMRESRKASERYDKWPAWRKGKEICKERWKWDWAKDRGQRLSDTHHAVAFRVSLDSYQRALHIMNAVALAAGGRGFVVGEDEKAGRVVFDGLEARLHLRITEQLEKRTRPEVRYDGKTEHKTYQVPSGRLRISVEGGGREMAFEDRKARSLDSQLNLMFVAMYRIVVKVRERERRYREAERQRQEEARIRAEEARLQAERERALAEERARRRRLSLEAHNWTRAFRIREYVAHIRAAATGSPAQAAVKRWSEWALEVAGDLDPTDTRLSNVPDAKPVGHTSRAQVATHGGSDDRDDNR